MYEDDEVFASESIIQNDMEADDHVRKIRYWQGYRDRMVDHFQKQIQLVTEKAESAISYHSHLLESYLATIPHKVTRTQESYQLPSGGLKVTRAHDAIVKDSEDKILLQLAQRGDNRFTKVKTTESLDWASYKKCLSIIDGKVYDVETGEAVDGAKVEHVEPKFSVKFNDDEEGSDNGEIQAS